MAEVGVIFLAPSRTMTLSSPPPSSPPPPRTNLAFATLSVYPAELSPARWADDGIINFDEPVIRHGG
ncbi:hypothetical protein HYPSUDRAFT_209530 [Hypholoma sublateritium FD-334 SS-4]|uniref:Uncharacterized protein n=1 Tax=Hypholoma sublateritium (strain FD-334 SS-4) TaxID=945553 RepID=A0A0D2NYB9_HYPSF|nr:hypothetical protein HYPSUDRAFT_209530 [Hypholoma sublateritium FD-334 SS-4]